MSDGAAAEHRPPLLAGECEDSVYMLLIFIQSSTFASSIQVLSIERMVTEVSTRLLRMWMLGSAGADEVGCWAGVVVGQ